MTKPDPDSDISIVDLIYDGNLKSCDKNDRMAWNGACWVKSTELAPYRGTMNITINNRAETDLTVDQMYPHRRSRIWRKRLIERAGLGAVLDMDENVANMTHNTAPIPGVRIVDLRPWWRQRAFWRGFAYGASLWPLLARYTLHAWRWLARRAR